MGPPSDNIDFFESANVRRRLAPRPDLRTRILDHLACWPSSGTQIAHQVWEAPLILAGEEVTVVYRRTGNRIGLMHVFEQPKESARLERIRLDVLQLYGPQR